MYQLTSVVPDGFAVHQSTVNANTENPISKPCVERAGRHTRSITAPSLQLSRSPLQRAASAPYPSVSSCCLRVPPIGPCASFGAANTCTEVPFVEEVVPLGDAAVDVHLGGQSKPAWEFPVLWVSRSAERVKDERLVT